MRRPIRPRTVARLSLVNHLLMRKHRGEDGRTLGSPGAKSVIKLIGVYTATSAIVGGNWNNDLQCGPFYANLNNTASNSNSNNGAALSYPLRMILLMQCISLRKQQGA